jgi:hypothetical protein
MKVIARITLREMTEDERPDEVGPTVVTANFDAMKAGRSRAPAFSVPSSEKHYPEIAV